MERNWRTWVVNITFAVTVLCWILDKAIGINANVVAMIPVGVFCATGIITKKTCRTSTGACSGWWPEDLLWARGCRIPAWPSI